MKLFIALTIISIVITPTFAITVQPTEIMHESKLQNCTWLLPRSEGLQLMNANTSVWRETVTRLDSANISCIIVWAGTWNADHTINYDNSPAIWSQFIATAKAVDPNFTVLALVYGSDVDISDPSYRTSMVTSVQQLMSSAPFDGWNDDLEGFTGTNQNAIDYWQAVASLVKGMGKIATVDLGVDWSYRIEEVYPYLTNFDYIMPMFYGTIQSSNGLSAWNRILSNSPVPVIMGLDVNHEEVNTSLSQQLSWIDQARANEPHANLAGYSFWAYDYWDNSGGSLNDFSAWSNWSTNDLHTSTATPLVTPLEIAFIAATITVTIVIAVFLFKKSPRRSVQSKRLNQRRNLNFEKIKELYATCSNKVSIACKSGFFLDHVLFR